MTLGLHEERNRRRRQRRWALVRVLILLAVIGSAAGLTYEAGRVAGTRQAADLRGEIAGLGERLAELEAQRAKLEVALAESEQGRAEAEARYERDVPGGEAGALLALGRRKLEEGVSAERLTSLLSMVKRQRDCSEEPVTRRFIVTTPLSSGSNNSVSFARGLVTVSAVGESASNEAGKPEAWFDPALPVTLRFTDLHGEIAEVVGRLPMTRSMVIGDREYRFTVSAGARGFAEVTGESCSFP